MSINTSSMANFSSEICPSWAEKIYHRPCLETLLPDGPITLDVLHYVYNLAWSIEIFRILITLIVVYCNKNSEGLSCKALMLCVLATICRFSNIWEVNERIFFIPKYTYLVVTFGLFIVSYTFRGAKDAKNDNKQSMMLLVLGCIAATLVRNDDDLGTSLATMALLLESATLISQLSLTYNNGIASVTASFFLASWVFSKFFLILYYVIIGFLGNNRAIETGDQAYGDFGYRVIINGNIVVLGLTIMMHHVCSVCKGFTAAVTKQYAEMNKKKRINNSSTAKPLNGVVSTSG